MKKLSIYMAALLSMFLVACSEDFDTEVGPQSYLPESALQMSDVTMASSISTINIQDLLDNGQTIDLGTVSVREGAMPANTILKAIVEFSKDANFENVVVLNAASLAESNVVSIDPSELQDAYFNDITRNPATTNLYVRTVLHTLTGETSEAIIGKPGENYFCEQTVVFTPLNKLQISSAYYVIGGAKGWNAEAARTMKFNHSDLDVYEDPVFSIIIDAAEGDTWFAFGDEEAIDAVAAGDWNQLFGTKGDSEDLTGTFDRRSVLGGDHSFCVKNAKKIRITINMMDMTYQIEPVNIADAYYLIGGPGEWNAESARTMKFNHSAADVFEDPVFTYTFAGTGGDMWFAFGDGDAIDAVAAGDWSRLFGTTGDSDALSGTFKNRYDLDGDHSFMVDGKAKYYRFTVNMAEKTYEIKALNYTEYIYEAGVNNDWGNYQQPLYSPEGDSHYTGYFYAQEADWTGGKGAFKFRGAADNWDNGNYGAGSNDDKGGSMIDDGNSGNFMVTPGFYRADVDMNTMSFTLTPINSVYVVGSAVNNDWDTGVKMTFNTAKHCWECDCTLGEGVIKFKGNGTWDNEDGNWGGTLDNIVNGSNDNIPVSVTGSVHIEFYPLCDTKSYATVTAK